MSAVIPIFTNQPGAELRGWLCESHAKQTTDHTLLLPGLKSKRIYALLISSWDNQTGTVPIYSEHVDKANIRSALRGSEQP